MAKSTTLSDKVYKEGGSLKFRPNLGLLGANVGFGIPQNITGIRYVNYMYAFE